MFAYIIRRLLLVPPTLFAIILINFAVVQVLPGGPVEQLLAELSGQAVDVTGRVSGNVGDEAAAGGGGAAPQAGENSTGKYRGAQGLPPEFIKQLEQQFGLDKPAHERFWLMLKNYVLFDFGNSYFKEQSVVGLVIEKMPVSISLGVWSTLLIYLISIPLGVAKAVRDGSRFDAWTSGIVIIGTAIPSFLLAVFLLVVFAGGVYLDWFPLRGLTSNNFEELSFTGKVLDYFWHLALPVTAITIGGFAALTMLTKNTFLDQINQQYVLTARSKGLTKTRVLYGHVFRNAMLIVIAGFPATLINMLFTGSVLIETIFSLDGLGLLGFEAIFQRDYPIVLGTLYFFTLFGLLLGIITDFVYTLVDPRIDFESRET